MKTGMNGVFGKVIAGVLAVILCVTGLGTGAAKAEGITTSAIEAVLSKYNFRSGMYWTYDYSKVSKNVNALDKAATAGYMASSRPYGSGTYQSAYYTKSKTHYGEYIFKGTRQCWAFADFIGCQLTGKVPSSQWTKYSVSQIEKAGGLRPGDVIRAGGHSAMVLRVSGSTVYTVECWGSAKSKNRIAVGGSFNSDAKTLKDINRKYGVNAVYRYGSAAKAPDDKAPVISASGEKYPAQGAVMEKGRGFGLRGVYTASSGKITQVAAALTDANGKAVYSFNAGPNAAKYDVNGTKGTNGKTLNDTIAFNRLAGGKYTLTITIRAENAGKKAVRTVIRTFTVRASAVAISVSRAFNGPGTIKKGSGFGLRGVAEAKNGRITQVTATVVDPSGSAVMVYIAKPGTASFDVTKTRGINGKSLNDTMAFNKLARGTYTYYVTVTAMGDGGTVTYDYSKTFTVR